MRKADWKKLIYAILLCQSAGVIGAIFTTPAIKSWYVYLNRPSFSPPNRLFGPVWLILYTLMGISFYLIWKKGLNKKKAKYALNIFVIHLALNTLWSIIFFGLRQIGVAFAEIFILWVFIIWIIFLFYKINKKAAYLLIPYFLWVSFASILNLFLIFLN